MVAAAITCGCSLHYLWLQPLLRLQVASLSNLATVYEAMEQAERAAAMHSLVAVHKSTWDEKQKQAAKRR